MITLPFQEKTMSTITELINHNQPVSVSPSAELFEGTDVYEYPVSWSGWQFLHLLLWYVFCLILACAQTSHGANLPISLSFMQFAVGLKRCSPV